MNERSIGLILSYINIILQIIVNLVCIPVLLHYIGKEQYGLYQLIAAVVAYIAIMDLGFSNAITRFYTMYFHQKNIEKAENTLAMASFVYAAIAILISFIGILIYCFFNEIFFLLYKHLYCTFPFFTPFTYAPHITCFTFLFFVKV